MDEMEPEPGFWREDPHGPPGRNSWRLYDEAEGEGFDVCFDDYELGEDPRDINEDALWEARLSEPLRAVLGRAA